MSRLSCYIIDDEETSIEWLTELVSDTPILQLVGSATDPFEALSFLRKNDVSLLFVDVNMEGMSGIELIKLVGNKAIFTTADESYALESHGYENVIGYLLKPITEKTFQLSIRKALNASIAPKEIPKGIEQEQDDVYHFKTTRGEKIIPYKTVDYIKAEGDYSIIFHGNNGNEQTVVPLGLKELEAEFTEPNFVRVHKSYIVNKTKVKMARYGKITLHSAVTIPVGRAYGFS